jgi:DNA repair protein RecN (Recombination protein N)
MSVIVSGSISLYEKDGQISYYEKGMDIVSFLISTNPGEPEKSLSKVASGGEISRIMLAIKTVVADIDRIPSLIFDEIDTGISGKAAQAVAEKLGQISHNHQVICVTHLPQIASMADVHFYISKSVILEKTKTSVDRLDEEGIIKKLPGC